MKPTSKRVAEWILAREELRMKGKVDDPILTHYRFCNVRREDDRVTRWLKKYWRDPFAGHPNMVGAMLLARMVNWPPTLEFFGFPKKWNPNFVADAINEFAIAKKAWSAAYIVSTCGQRMDKAVYVCQTVSEVIGKPWYTPTPNDTLQAVWQRLKGVNGLGAGFIAAQVVADLKYELHSPLTKASDWYTWACSGPGSRRGLNRYYDMDKNTPWAEPNWLDHLHRMIAEVEMHLPRRLQNLHAQDWQNVMCEWDKYERTRLGEGTPRKTYTPETAYTI